MSDLLNSASLVMIPSGYKEDTVFSAIPTDGSGDLSFTRASNGTRVNSAGLVEVCPWNLAEQSETFDNATWVKTTDGQVTISANATTAPNGTTTADKMIASANAGFHCVAQTQSLVAGVFTISVYAKASEYTFLQIFDSLTTDFANFNLTTGAVATVDQYTATIENVGNGWYRCTASKSNPSGNFVFRYGIVTTGTATRGESFTGNGVNGLFIWGAQVNIGSTAKPYFPTTDRLNVPRLTYQNGGGGCPSLLLEKQSTNLLTYSEQFDNVAWTKAAVSVTANNITSPDGTQNADLLTTTSASICGAYQLISTGSGTFSFSLFAKKGNNNYLALNAQSSSADNCTAIFDLSDGTLGEYQTKGTTAYVSHKIENFGNDWYRCTMVLTTTTSVYFFPMFAPLKTGNTFNPSGEVNVASGKTLYLWGAQLEASSYPTSYIPTTSASATRVADYTSRSGLALTNFTFSVNFKPLDYIVELFDFQKTGGGRMFYVAVQSSGFITFNSVSGGTIGAIGSIIPKNETCKLAFKLNASTSDLTVFINGSNIGTYTTDITTFGQLLGLQSFGYNPGTQIEQIAIFPSVLTDAECISLTTI